MLNRRRRRIPPGGLLPFIALVLLMLLLVEGFMLVERKIRPVFLAAAVMECDGIATRAINSALLDKVVSAVEYGELIVTEKDAGGKIVMAQINTLELNRIIALTTMATLEALTGISERKIKIPLGRISGSYILAPYGPKITVRLKPLGRVNTEVLDSFEDAGINQTRHKIYLQVTTELQVIVPLLADSLEVLTTVPLADTIYIGEVPETLVNLSFSAE